MLLLSGEDIRKIIHQSRGVRLIRNDFIDLSLGTEGDNDKKCEKYFFHAGI